MPGPSKGVKRMAKKPMPNQGIGSASSKSNLIGKRKMRHPLLNVGNQEPHMPGKDFLPSKIGRKRMRSANAKGKR